ncbi:GNAT family N-acetyltransferase [soil metagenome]
MLRFAHQDDLPFLKWMLFEACYPEGAPRPPFEKGIADPKVWVYLDGWVRTGDAGLIVATDAGGPMGAAWYRLFTADAPGYGFIDEQTPELAIGLVFEARGRGLGTQLLRNLMSLANKQGHKQISLSVDHTNPRARQFYERLGFAEVSRDAEGARMVADLTKPIPDPKLAG